MVRLFTTFKDIRRVRGVILQSCDTSIIREVYSVLPELFLVVVPPRCHYRTEVFQARHHEDYRHLTSTDDRREYLVILQGHGCSCPANTVYEKMDTVFLVEGLEEISQILLGLGSRHYAIGTLV